MKIRAFLCPLERGEEGGEGEEEEEEQEKKNQKKIKGKKQEGKRTPVHLHVTTFAGAGRFLFRPVDIWVSRGFSFPFSRIQFRKKKKKYQQYQQ